MATEQLGTNCTKHDEHEHEKHGNIQHNWQRAQNGQHQLTHVWDLIQCFQRTQQPQYLNGGNVTGIDELREPTEHNDDEIEL